MEDRGFSPWQIEWTATHVKRFWDWISAQHNADYFSVTCSDALLDELRAITPLRGAAVDYAAGVGGLTEKLLSRGTTVYAVDNSPESVETLRRRFGGHPGFRGAFVIDQD